MRKHYPLNSNGAEDAGKLPWTDGVPATGVEGSYPGQALFTDTESEILSAIDAAGLARSSADLTQLVQAIARGGIWLGQFAGTATALTATVPNGAVIPVLLAGMRVRGIAASNYVGSGGTLAITGIGGAAATVSYPLIGADGVTPLATGAWSAGQFISFEIDASGNARFGSGANASTSNATPIAQAAKALFNAQQFTTSARVSMSTSGVGVAVTAWSGFSFTKKSATSDLLVISNFECRSTSSPGNGYGGSYINLNIGSSTQKIVAVNGYPGYAALNTFARKISGLGTGAQAVSISFEREDANTWTTVFNPTSADESGRLSTNTAYLLIAEVEPT